MRRNLDYKADLLADLRNDLGYAARYLSAAIADSREAFLIALRDVAEAQKGIPQVAAEAGVNRENLYRTLSEGGNPRLTTLIPVLSTLGLRITLEPEQAAQAAKVEDSSSCTIRITNITGNILESVSRTTLSRVTTSFAGTLLDRAHDPDIPVFEARDVPVHLLTEEKTSEGIFRIQ